MAHYAKVLDGKVVNVISSDSPPSIDTSPGEWIETSYNTRGGVHYDPQNGKPSADQSKALRKNYAGIGYSYDQQRDAFYSQQPYPSWTLDEQTCFWTAPVAMPNDGEMYDWDEDSGSWVEAPAA